MLIIGAGMAGWTAAAELQRAGRRVLLLDKGRGVGGRLASRRMGEASLDHGAQLRQFVWRNRWTCDWLGVSEKKLLIVGGGLAGLACALRLHEAGARPFIFERSDGVGGRVRTDQHDGFLLDRGFQVFLDAYPEAGDLLDKESLNLRAFRPGALIYRTSGMRRVMDVFREPRHLMESALAPVGSIADKLRVARLRWRLMRLTSEEIAGHEDMTTENYLKHAGFSPAMIDGFFRSFYGGIFLERELQTSSRMFEAIGGLSRCTGPVGGRPCKHPICWWMRSWKVHSP